MIEDHIEQQIVLASASPRRADILRTLGVPFEVIVSGANEEIDPTSVPEHAAMETARRKADTVSKMTGTEKPILGCDTIVVLDGVVFGKPHDREDAIRMLRALSGRTHQVVSGVCIRYHEHDIAFSQTTAVTFYDLPDHLIERYVATGEPLDKAGAYGIQGLGALLVRGIDGDFYNVVGLPVARTLRELSKLTDGQVEEML